MKGGITGRLQEAKLRRLDKSLIECRLLSSDFPIFLFLEAITRIFLDKPLAEKARRAPLHSLLSQGPRSPSQPALFRRILHPWAYGLAGLPFPPELHGCCPVPQSDMIFGCELYSARSQTGVWPCHLTSLPV